MGDQRPIVIENCFGIAPVAQFRRGCSRLPAACGRCGSLFACCGRVTAGSHTRSCCRFFGDVPVQSALAGVGNGQRLVGHGVGRLRAAQAQRVYVDVLHQHVDGGRVGVRGGSYRGQRVAHGQRRGQGGGATVVLDALRASLVLDAR